MLKKYENLIVENKTLLISISLFFGWSLVVGAGFLILYSAIFLFLFKNLLMVTSFITAFCLFLVGLFTVKEKEWSYIGWFVLTPSILFFILAVPGGMEAKYVLLWTVLNTIIVYLSFSYKVKPTVLVYIFGIALLMVFNFYVFILAKPELFGIIVKDNVSKIQDSTVSTIMKMKPEEIIKVDEGRRIAIKVYNVSPIISDKDLADLVAKNPEPLIKLQQEIPAIIHSSNFESSIYKYILNVYLSALVIKK